MHTLKTVLIGAGNVATHLGPALGEADCQVIQVFSRTQKSAERLADELDCRWTTDLTDVTPEAELYVFCVSDAALPLLARQLFEHFQLTATEADNDAEEVGARALFVHTAGSLSVDVLPSLRRGVLYPLQTFSREQRLDLSEVPFLVESESDEALLVTLAQHISNRVLTLDGESRRQLHLAAVFACNFVNHMYHLSERLLSERGIPFSLLLPLIDETARKVHSLPPAQAQTGPAVRMDRNVMQRQLDMLDDPQMKQIYELVSQSIHDKLRPEED